jgi:hypothetical protein
VVEQQATGAGLPGALQDEEVFEVDGRPSQKAGISLEPNRVTDRMPLSVDRQSGLEASTVAETVGAEAFDGCVIRSQELFVVGERADQAHEVVEPGGAHGYDRHVRHSAVFHGTSSS